MTRVCLCTHCIGVGAMFQTCQPLTVATCTSGILDKGCIHVFKLQSRDTPYKIVLNHTATECDTKHMCVSVTCNT